MYMCACICMCLCVVIVTWNLSFPRLFLNEFQQNISWGIPQITTVTLRFHTPEVKNIKWKYKETFRTRRFHDVYKKLTVTNFKWTQHFYYNSDNIITSILPRITRRDIPVSIVLSFILTWYRLWISFKFQSRR